MRYNIAFSSKLVVLMFLLFTITLPAVFINSVHEANADDEKIELSLYPKEQLFNVHNMAPGDKLSKELQVYNKDESNVTYKLNIQFKNGSEILYEELKLKISENNNKLYYGSLAQSPELTRKLISTSHDNLNFSVELPISSSNEYQGLETSFNIELNSSLIPISTGETLPNTATDLYNFLIVGACMMLCGVVLSLYLYRKRLSIDSIRN